MIVISFIGGLGNQMFQYALYKKFQMQGKEVEGNWNFCEHNYINTVFGLEVLQASDEAIRNLGDFSTTFYSNMRRKFLGNKKTYWQEGNNTRYIPEILDLREGYLHGYWQSEKYFKDIRKELLMDFQFPQCLNNRNKEILRTVEATNSVSVHIRRGDYLQGEENYNYFGEVCSLEYYQNAMEYFRTKLENVSFFIFSNDMEWSRENLKGNDCFYIDWNNGIEDYLDMYLMSKCKHNIIANSSFSWWGAWLNENTQKQVIVPIRWFNKYSAEDTICDTWIRIQ